MARDYTGLDPAFKVTDEVLRKDSLINNRAVLGEGAFYTDTLTLIVPSTGEPYTDWLPKVVFAAAAGKSAKAVHCVLEFPYGVPEDLHATYQCVEKGNFDQITQLTTMLSNLSDTADNVLYSEVENRPIFLNTAEHEHLTKDLVVEAIVAAVMKVNEFKEQEYEDQIALKLKPYQPITDDKLETDAKTIPEAVNEVRTRLTSLLSSLVGYQLKEDPKLNTTDKTVVGGINEVLQAILGTASKLDDKLDFIGALAANTDLTPQCTGGSKMWVVMTAAPVTISGKLSDGPGSFSAALGDVIYYDNESGHLINSGVGAYLASKLDRIDNGLETESKEIVGSINEINKLVHSVRGTGEVPFVGYLSADTNLTISDTISDGDKGYWITIRGGVRITAPWSDGDVTKSLAGGVVVEFDGTHTRALDIATYDAVKQKTVDPSLVTQDKSIVGAINEIEGLINFLQQKDVMDFGGYLDSDVTLPGGITSSTMWFVNTPGGETIDITGIWHGSSTASTRTLFEGDSVFYDHPTRRLFTMAIGETIKNKQSKIDANLKTTDKTVVGAINEVHDLSERLDGSHPALQGYLVGDTNISAQCAGSQDKEWVIAKDGIRITAPFVSGGSLQTLNVGKTIRYNGGNGQTTIVNSADIPQELLGYVDPTLNTVNKTIIGAINELLQKSGESLAELDEYLLKTPGGLATAAGSVVGAINELKSRIDTLFSDLNVQLDFMGYISTATNLTGQQNGTSKVWVVTGNSVDVTANWTSPPGTTTRNCVSGDVLYYNSKDGKLFSANLGKEIRTRQYRSDVSLATENKIIVDAINEIFGLSKDVYGGGDYPLAQILTANTNLTGNSLIGADKKAYWLIGRSSLVITGPWKDGSGSKTVSSSSVVVSDAGKIDLKNLATWRVKRQAVVDTGLSTVAKDVVGAINELKSKHDAVDGLVTLEMKGYLTGNTNLPPSNPTTSYLYIVRTSGSITVNGIWYGNSSSSNLTMRDGDIVVYNHVDKRLYYSRAGTVAYGKQDPSSSSLQTTNKTIVGAINELRTAINSINLSSYQPKSDSGLNTTNKTVVGAINEVRQDILDLQQYQVGDVFSTERDLSDHYDKYVPLGSGPQMKTTYPRLWAVLGVRYGGDGNTTFGIPPAIDGTTIPFYIVAD